MMDDGLIKEIKSVGYWRVNFRPTQEHANQLSLGQCRDLVRESSVSLRGWDFPHINTRDDEYGGSDREPDFFQQWTRWYGMHEFWRMYRSAQFLSYLSLREDTRPDEHGNPTVPVLHVVPTIYSVAEFVEFAQRLTRKGIYERGLTVSVTLFGTKGRVLVAGRNRIPFFERMTTSAESIAFESTFNRSDFLERSRDIATDICMEIFDQFGWNPSRSQIQSDQDRFFERDFT